MKNVIDFIWTVFHPSFWIMNDPYNEKLDKYILQAIKENKVKRLNRHEIQVGTVILWGENYPYSFGTLGDLRASRRTIHKLAEIVQTPEDYKNSLLLEKLK